MNGNDRDQIALAVAGEERAISERLTTLVAVAMAFALTFVVFAAVLLMISPS